MLLVIFGPIRSISSVISIQQFFRCRYKSLSTLPGDIFVHTAPEQKSPASLPAKELVAKHGDLGVDFATTTVTHQKSGMMPVDSVEHIGDIGADEIIDRSSTASINNQGNDNATDSRGAGDVSEKEHVLPPEQQDGSSTAGGMRVLDFCRLVHQLKHLPRAGWARAGVAGRTESVAGHMYRMALLAFLLDDKQVDRMRCVRIALVHDLAESLVGDITPHCGVPDHEKFRRESQAMDQIARLLPGGVGDEMESLWKEYEAQETKEARLVKQLDRFDLLVQAYEYEQDQRASPGSLDEFFRAAPLVRDAPVADWTRQLLDQRRLAKSQPPPPPPTENNDE